MLYPGEKFKIREILRLEFQTNLRGQTDGKPINGTEYENIIVGWNAWRLLCSNKRREITEDWICARLITGREDLARTLWHFFKEMTAS